jgi:TolB protein
LPSGDHGHPFGHVGLAGPGQRIDRRHHGKIDVEAAIPVAVLSSDAQWQRRLSTAFGAHGAYTLSPQAGAAYTIRIDPAGPSSAQLQVQQGAQTVLSRTVQGSNGTDAAMRAADLAVTQTSKLPGIFAGRLAFIGERNGSSDLYILQPLLHGAAPAHERQGELRAAHPVARRQLRPLHQLLPQRVPDIYRIDLNTGRRDAFLSFSGVTPARSTATTARASPSSSRARVTPRSTRWARTRRTMKRLTRNKSIESSPSWSPDNSKIVFASDASTSRPQLFQVSANGGAMTRIPTEVSGYCAEPAWKPRPRQPDRLHHRPSSEFEIALWDSTKPPARGITQGAGRRHRALLDTRRAPPHLHRTHREPPPSRPAGHQDRQEDLPARRRLGSASQADYAYPQ